MLLLLLLLFSLPLAEGRAALQEEVNVLVYGTLQLGQALSDTYSKTAGKLQRVEGRQNRQEQGLTRMEEEVTRARREARRLDAEVGRLQREEQEIRTLSSTIMGELRDLQRDYDELQRRIRKLEDGVEEKEGDAPALRAQLERHQLILQVVVEAMTQQQAQMTKQGTQLNDILRKASAVGSR
ncbi:angiopoietin-like protein 8 [Pelodytes ibericus]